MADRLISDSGAAGFAVNAPKPLRDTPSPAAERAKVAELAQQFEAMLMNQMVQQMRKSLLDEDESEGTGFGASTMRETFDTEFAGYLARAGGVGFAGFMTRTLDDRAAAEAAAAAARTDVTSLAGARTALHPLAPAQGVAHLLAPASAPAIVAGTSAIGRSTDNPDAPASVALPLDNGVSSRFGWRSDPFTGHSRFHRGVDLRATYGTEVPAAAGGTVVFAGERGTYGNLVVMRHANGVETRYAHLSAVEVKEGDVVEAGSAVGRVGSTGRSAAPHLHFEVLVNGERVDPAEWAGRVGRGPLKSDDRAVD
jgi:murein DD-endopeptidase MepM/ murein hydrolase activator NlpD